MLDQLDLAAGQRRHSSSSPPSRRTLQQEPHRGSLDAQLAELEKLRKDLNDNKNTIQEKLNKAQQLLDTGLGGRAQGHPGILQRPARTSGRTTRASIGRAHTLAHRPAERPGVRAGRQGHRVRAAPAARRSRTAGARPGPSSFDCSGLTQQAWAAAGDQAVAHHVGPGQRRPRGSPSPSSSRATWCSSTATTATSASTSATA
ncbi:hypothetical protein ACU686_17615 [Yinghuangia aomiensis]